MKVKTVEILARWLHVPIKINQYDLYEVKTEDIRLYVEDCLIIGEKVFEMDDDELAAMGEHFNNFHMQMMDNPFNLHDAAFTRVCSWHDIHRGNDPLLPVYTARYRRALENGMKLNAFENAL